MREMRKVTLSNQEEGLGWHCLWLGRFGFNSSYDPVFLRAELSLLISGGTQTAPAKAAHANPWHFQDRLFIKMSVQGLLSHT